MLSKNLFTTPNKNQETNRGKNHKRLRDSLIFLKLKKEDKNKIFKIFKGKI